MALSSFFLRAHTRPSSPAHFPPEVRSIWLVWAQLYCASGFFSGMVGLEEAHLSTVQLVTHLHMQCARCGHDVWAMEHPSTRTMSSGSSKGFTLAWQIGGVFVRHVGITNSWSKECLVLWMAMNVFPGARPSGVVGTIKKGGRAWKNVEADKCKK